MIEMLVLLIESDETVAAMLSADMWKMFISWAIKYAHNNIYHALFYRLLFAVLRFAVNLLQDLYQKLTISIDMRNEMMILYIEVLSLQLTFT